MYNYNLDDTVVSLFTSMFFLIFYLAIFGLSIASYVMISLSLYKIANRRQIKNPWLAWLPIGNYWIMGSIADEFGEHFGSKSKWRIILMLLYMAFLVMFILYYIIAVVIIVAFIINAINFDNVTAGNIFSGIIALIIFYFFVIALAIASNVCYYICLYKIFKSTVPEKTIMYLLLSIFIPFASAVCLFKCRDKGYSKSPVYYGNQPPMYNQPY